MSPDSAVEKLGGIRVFSGLYDFSVLSGGWPSRQTLGAVLLDSSTTFAPKLRFSLALWAGVVVNLILLAWPRGRSRGRRPVLAAGLAFPLLGSLLYFKVVPFREHQRLIFPVYYALFLGLAGALAGAARVGGPRLSRGLAWVAPLLVLVASPKPAGGCARELAAVRRHPRLFRAIYEGGSAHPIRFFRAATDRKVHPKDNSVH
jgi:hypothetical protein